MVEKECKEKAEVRREIIYEGTKTCVTLRVFLRSKFS